MSGFIESGILTTEYYGNTVQRWLSFICLSLLFLVIFRVALWVVTKEFSPIVKKSKALWDTALMEALESTRLGFLATIAFYIGSQSLTLNPKVEKGVSSFLFLALFAQGIVWGMKFINSYIQNYVSTAVSDDGAKLTTVNAIAFLVKAGFLVLLALWTLDNFGINVTTFMTGLGIGGVAIALAVQNILGDLFASLTIVFDKPFVIGDSIIVGDVSGTIEYIGLKTTRIRSGTGEQIILPNSKLLQSQIHNMKRMQERTVGFNFGVTYETPTRQVSEIPEVAKRIVEAQGTTRFLRANFMKFGESSLDFEVRYTVLSADNDTYLDIQQNINLALLSEFEKRKIQFAYPTRTIYTQK